MTDGELLRIAESMLKQGWVIAMKRDRKEGEQWYAQDPVEKQYGPYVTFPHLLRDLEHVQEYS